MEWISVDERLPELIGKWRTGLPIYVKIKGFGVSLAYPCKWKGDPFCWLPANIMCDENQAFAPVDEKNHVEGVTHWMPEPPKN